jgi:hypothetical protein
MKYKCFLLRRIIEIFVVLFFNKFKLNCEKNDNVLELAYFEIRLIDFKNFFLIKIFFVMREEY